MNLYDVRLLNVRIQDIRAKAPSFESESEEGYNARLNVEILNPGDNLAVGDKFRVQIALVTTEDDKPFLQMTMIGVFEVLGEAALTDLSHENAPYELGSLLYPYLRNLTKPIIEYLGASDVEMPFAPPSPPPPDSKPKRKATKRKVPAQKNLG